jgi:hypothetical protein
MAEPFAIPGDVAVLLGRDLTAAEHDMVSARLDQASAMIRLQVPGLDGRIASGVLSSTVVAGVAADMVLRVVHNPTGVRTTTRAIDDYQRSDTVDSSRSEGALYLSEREAAMLRGRRSRAFSIIPSSGPSWVCG